MVHVPALSIGYVTAASSNRRPGVAQARRAGVAATKRIAINLSAEGLLFALELEGLGV
ncbi:hypothetical protein ACW0JT_25085 [Arthrobacter sp. SA17]